MKTNLSKKITGLTRRKALQVSIGLVALGFIAGALLV